MLRIGRGPTVSTRILRLLPKHERPQILATRKTRLTSGKARQHPIPMLVANLLIPNPNVVIVAKRNITITKNNAKLTDCQQTLVAEDLVSACGLVLDQTKKKKIKSVDGNRVPCSGSTSFQAMYGGERGHP